MFSIIFFWWLMKMMCSVVLFWTISENMILTMKSDASDLMRRNSLITGNYSDSGIGVAISSTSYQLPSPNTRNKAKNWSNIAFLVTSWILTSYSLHHDKNNNTIKPHCVCWARYIKVRGWSDVIWRKRY